MAKDRLSCFITIRLFILHHAIHKAIAVGTITAMTSINAWVPIYRSCHACTATLYGDIDCKCIVEVHNFRGRARKIEGF